MLPPPVANPQSEFTILNRAVAVLLPLSNSEAGTALVLYKLQRKMMRAGRRLDKVEIVENCRDHHNQRSCKICASCVNFPKKQSDFLHNLRRTTGFIHTKRDFALKLLRFHTLISNKKATEITDITN